MKKLISLFIAVTMLLSVNICVKADDKLFFTPQDAVDMSVREREADMVMMRTGPAPLDAFSGAKGLQGFVQSCHNDTP